MFFKDNSQSSIIFIKLELKKPPLQIDLLIDNNLLVRPILYDLILVRLV